MAKIEEIRAVVARRGIPRDMWKTSEDLLAIVDQLLAQLQVAEQEREALRHEWNVLHSHYQNAMARLAERPCDCATTTRDELHDFLGGENVGYALRIREQTGHFPHCRLEPGR